MELINQNVIIRRNRLCQEETEQDRQARDQEQEEGLAEAEQVEEWADREQALVVIVYAPAAARRLNISPESRALRCNALNAALIW
ncbi:MAG: hypothetical protein ACQEP5_02240 [Actinomycetota bacterium]